LGFKLGTYSSFHLFAELKSVSHARPKNATKMSRIRERTWMFVLEFGQVVYVFVNDNPKAIRLVVFSHVLLTKCFGHDDSENGLRSRRERI
jgi:hypothetical protein